MEPWQFIGLMVLVLVILPLLLELLGKGVGVLLKAVIQGLYTLFGGHPREASQRLGEKPQIKNVVFFAVCILCLFVIIFVPFELKILAGVIVIVSAFIFALLMRSNIEVKKNDSISKDDRGINKPNLDNDCRVPITNKTNGLSAPEKELETTTKCMPKKKTNSNYENNMGYNKQNLKSTESFWHEIVFNLKSNNKLRTSRLELPQDWSLHWGPDVFRHSSPHKMKQTGVLNVEIYNGENDRLLNQFALKASDFRNGQIETKQFENGGKIYLKVQPECLEGKWMMVIKYYDIHSHHNTMETGHYRAIT
jgi:hypothetical protein